VSRLFMGSGKLLKDQSLLLTYFEILESMNIRNTVSIPTSEDIEFLVKAVRIQNLSLLDAITMLTRRFAPRIVAEAARKAIEKVLGRDVDTDLAVELIAKDLALWTLEIAENLGLIRVDTSMLS